MTRPDLQFIVQLTLKLNQLDVLKGIAQAGKKITGYRVGVQAEAEQLHSPIRNLKNLQ